MINLIVESETQSFLDFGKFMLDSPLLQDGRISGFGCGRLEVIMSDSVILEMW